MGDFFVYILKSSVCLAVFYLFYRLLLSRETFHRFNRIALLGIIALSVAIPFIRVITEEPVAIQRSLQNLEDLLQMAQEQEMPMLASRSVWLPLLFIVYLAGCIFFSARFFYSTFLIWRMIKKGEKHLLPEGCKLAVVKDPIAPFSWMGYIVISQKDKEESGEEILTHEMAHIRANHSLDMLVCSWCVILQWFNPAAWLLKQELQNIHEYEADESVINHGVDARKYQLLLIKKAVGTQRFTSLANSFNHSKLKKRISMMLKQKSNRWARLKYLYVLPLTAFAVIAFARPEISGEMDKISNAGISEIASPVLQFSPQKSKERLKKIEKKVDMSRNLILIDNEVADYDQLEALSPDRIYSFNVTPKERSKEILEKYNATDKQGVITVVTKNAISSGKVKEEEVKVVGFGESNKLHLPADVTLHSRNGKSSMEKPLVIIDGVEQEGEDALEKIDPQTIESISVLKDQTAVKKYGERGKDGVIMIVTKNSLLKKLKE